MNILGINITNKFKQSMLTNLKKSSSMQLDATQNASLLQRSQLPDITQLQESIAIKEDNLLHLRYSATLINS
jgi:hypothetical protein